MLKAHSRRLRWHLLLLLSHPVAVFSDRLNELLEVEVPHQGRFPRTRLQRIVSIIDAHPLVSSEVLTGFLAITEWDPVSKQPHFGSVINECSAECIKRCRDCAYTCLCFRFINACSAGKAPCQCSQHYDNKNGNTARQPKPDGSRSQQHTAGVHAKVLHQTNKYHSKNPNDS